MSSEDRELLEFTCLCLLLRVPSDRECTACCVLQVVQARSGGSLVVAAESGVAHLKIAKVKL